MSETDPVVFEVTDGIGHVRFRRPEKLQAFTPLMYRKVQDICQSLQQSREVHAVVFCGATDVAFSAGTDLAEYAAIETPEQGLALDELMDAVLDAVERCPIPTIAAIAGICSGGGLSFAAACDLRVAAPNARFSLPVGRTLGLGLSPSSYERLHALIGPAPLRHLLFTGQPISAARALEVGLVDELVNDQSALSGRADYLARLAVSQAPLAIQATKDALLSLRPRLDRERAGAWARRGFASADFRAAVDAFLSKRQANFSGR